MFWVYRARRGVSIAGFAALALLWGARSGQALDTGDADVRPNAANAYQAVTGDDSDDDRQRWDEIFSRESYVFGKDPAPFLKDHVALLPVGRALDIAMGEGRNAVFLAKKGFQVEGVDYSEVALRKAKKLAKENKVSIRTIYADLNSYSIKPESYQVIVNIDYLQRSLIPQIKRGLKKGGVVVFENATIDQLKLSGNSSIPRDQLLQKDELRQLFRDFEILKYEETNDGKDAKARLIARKAP